MKSLTKVVFLLTFLVIVLGGMTEVRADEVVIIDGFVIIGGPVPPGNGTFRSTTYSLSSSEFTNDGFEGDGVMHDVMSPCIFAPCLPGTLVSASSIVMLNGVGPATVNGVTYPLATAFGPPLTFTTANVAIPTGGGLTVTITTPFTMTGSLGIFSLPGGNPVFSVTTVSGSGLATLTLHQLDSGYVLANIRYDFQEPVPEPATMVLLGLGLAGVGVRGMVHQRNKKVRLKSHFDRQARK